MMAPFPFSPAIAVLISCVHLTIAQESYTATVLEYARTADSVSDYDNVLMRATQYVRYMEEAKSGIVVFPEYGLTTPYLPKDLNDISTAVPDPTENVAPCDDTDRSEKHLADLSCGARAHGVYAVVNLVERANSSDGTPIYYNTNVVFDPQGRVIARYRKINLCGEPKFAKGENATAFTAFGVKFGLMTDCDLLFSHPSTTLLRDNVTDVVYPNSWTSETPFLQGLSLQDGFAKANGLNFLSASYSNSSVGMGGAAIFLADSTVGAMSITTAITTNTIRASVKKVTSRTPQAVCQNNLEVEPRIGGQLPDIGQFYTRTEDMDLYTFQDLDMSQAENKVQVCSEGSLFCCDFYVKIKQGSSSPPTQVYKVAAFYGNKRVNGISSPLGFRTCAIVACATSDKKSCGQRPSGPNVTFESIAIKTNLPRGQRALYAPSTLGNDLKPFKNYRFCQSEDVENDVVGTTMSVDNVDGLVTFGIFGRVYENDGQPEGRGSGSYLRSGFGLIFTLLISRFLIQ